MADQPRQRPSLAARVLGRSARAAETVAGATGIDDAVELAVEEAIVSALQSPAVERAVLRVLEGPAAEEALQRLLASPAVERAMLETLDSALVDKVWGRLLESDEVQRLIERIAEAPEVRAAITSQGVGLLEDLGRKVRGIAHRIDGIAESFARRVIRRPQRTEPSDDAGLATRALGFVIDAAIVNGSFLAVSALVTFVLNALFESFESYSAPVLALGGVLFIVLTSCYLLFFWTLAGQTPGMRLLGIRLAQEDGTWGLSGRRAFRRLIGVYLSILTLGIGFLPVLVSDRRRGLADRMADTEVILVDRQGRPESAAHRVAVAEADEPELQRLRFGA
jgi:uncharacterized RDD family membrane protein YckC